MTVRCVAFGTERLALPYTKQIPALATPHVNPNEALSLARALMDLRIKASNFAFSPCMGSSKPNIPQGSIPQII